MAQQDNKEKKETKNKVNSENKHPNYKKIQVVCTCGNSFTTGSALGSDNLKIEVCSNCHPFYTGKQKIVDTGGRVSKFNDRYSSGKKKTGG